MIAEEATRFTRCSIMKSTRGFAFSAKLSLSTSAHREQPRNEQGSHPLLLRVRGHVHMCAS